MSLAYTVLVRIWTNRISRSAGTHQSKRRHDVSDLNDICEWWDITNYDVTAGKELLKKVMFESFYKKKTEMDER